MRRKPKRNLYDVFVTVNRCQMKSKIRKRIDECRAKLTALVTPSMVFFEPFTSRYFSCRLSDVVMCTEAIKKHLERICEVKEDENATVEDAPAAGESDWFRSILERKNSRKWDTVIPDTKQAHTFHSGKRSDCR